MSRELSHEIDELIQAFQEEIARVQSQQQYRELKEKYFSRRKGICTLLMQRLRDVPATEKAEAGRLINRFKQTVSDHLDALSARLNRTTEPESDWTLPPQRRAVGALHLIERTRAELEGIFIQMGYEVAEGPEMESEYNNFTALNIPAHHPARDEQDTFFIQGWEDGVLRTHTSPVQIRYMKAHQPPFKAIFPGKVFRKDEPDATHTPVFHQIEGLLVDRDVKFSHLRGTLEAFIHAFFGADITTRFRPGYFPFTEPSAEIDISCFLCFGNNPECRICKGTGWLEILGCGMVHPNVLQNCGIDADEFSGFAFGMGVDRIALLRHGVPDLRMLFENDLRFLRQFG
ncbi:MAG: phenylalanine--tRNA ligase subunit alpha [Acidobacteriota bacterium]|jgi:phenylalanyl-tRNA synthetase alpha chain|nr:phenylalanine--tRNA ligase subunit alpha [Acidobacteriota bacterium]